MKRGEYKLNKRKRQNEPRKCFEDEVRREERETRVEEGGNKEGGKEGREQEGREKRGEGMNGNKEERK